MIEDYPPVDKIGVEPRTLAELQASLRGHIKSAAEYLGLTAMTFGLTAICWYDGVHQDVPAMRIAGIGAALATAAFGTNASANVAAALGDWIEIKTTETHQDN